MSSFKVLSYKNHSETINPSLFFAHTHEYYELYCFLSGDAVFSVEGNVYPLKQGDILLMNKAETHHIIHKSDTPYTRMCLHFWYTDECHPDFKSLLAPFSNRPLGYYNRYPSHVFQDNKHMYYLEEIYNTKDKTKKQVYLMALLQELCDCFPKIKEMPIVNPSDNLNRITHYINTHLADSLHLEDICEQFYISKSQLQRNFNSNLGITIGDYILTKRLIYAQSLIKKGKKPTEIFLQCGFQNYSGFFKAYKKHFGHSPSQELIGNIVLPAKTNT